MDERIDKMDVKTTTGTLPSEAHIDLSMRSHSFSVSERIRVEHGGHGLKVGKGDIFRFVILERPQILDVMMYNAEDPSEHYAAGSQMWKEGGHITRFTRIWGTPPESRPLAICLNNSIRHRDTANHSQDHATHGAHCNPHHWILYEGRHPRTCYDNLREGLWMLNMGQTWIHDNMNLFQKTGIDPISGSYVVEHSDGEPGDYIEFYAEMPLLVVVSLCPYGEAGIDRNEWGNVDEDRVAAIRIEVAKASDYGNGDD